MSLLKTILIGGAAYLAYRRYFASPAASGSADGGAGTTESGAATQPGSPYPEPQLDTKGQLLRLARAAGYSANPLLLTYDEWNFFYQQLRGTSAGAFEDVVTAGADRAYRMTSDEFMSYLTAKGLAGLVWSVV